jgi:hypothetical protein
MRVFISWAKEPSRTVAGALRDWLPDIIQSIEPWVSSADIGAGARWSAEIAQALSTARIGIICTTPENQIEPWLLFETGALAKTLEDTFVCPYLIGMHPSDLAAGPLTQFQSKVANKEGTFELVSTVNRALVSDGLPVDRLRRLFERSWPDLEGTLNSIPRSPAMVQRPTEEMISEVLETVRSLARRIPEPPPAPSPDERSVGRRRLHENLTRSMIRNTFPNLNEVQLQDVRKRIRELSDEELAALSRTLRSDRQRTLPVSDVLNKVFAPFAQASAAAPLETTAPTNTTQADPT